MKSIHITLVALFISAIASAQKIKVSEDDKFVKAYRIETNSVIVKMGLSMGLTFGIRSVGNNFFLKASGYGIITSAVEENGVLILLDKRDSTVEVFCTSLTFTSKSNGKELFAVQYKMSLSDIEKLSRYKIKAIRMYGINGYRDIDIKEKDSADINNLCSVFLAEYDNKVLKK